MLLKEKADKHHNGLIIPGGGLLLKLRCDYASRYLVPAVRALVASMLIEKYRLTQVRAAELLGTTQPAISHYLRSKRGMKVLRFIREDEELMKMIDELASKLVKGEEIKDFFCEICRKAEQYLQQ